MGIEFVITAFCVLLAIGILIYCVDLIPGLPAPIPVVIKIILLLCVALWLLRHAGVV